MKGWLDSVTQNWVKTKYFSSHLAVYNHETISFVHIISTSSSHAPT
jgi:hypothetical protein